MQHTAPPQGPVPGHARHAHWCCSTLALASLDLIWSFACGSKANAEGGRVRREGTRAAAQRGMQGHDKARGEP
jgi:hypothetical protein